MHMIRKGQINCPQGSSTSAVQQFYSLANWAAAIGQIQHAPLLLSRQNLRDTHVLQGESKPIRVARILFIEGRPSAHRRKTMGLWDRVCGACKYERRYLVADIVVSAQEIHHRLGGFNARRLANHFAARLDEVSNFAA